MDRAELRINWIDRRCDRNCRGNWRRPQSRYRSRLSDGAYRCQRQRRGQNVGRCRLSDVRIMAPSVKIVCRPRRTPVGRLLNGFDGTGRIFLVGQLDQDAVLTGELHDRLGQPQCIDSIFDDLPGALHRCAIKCLTCVGIPPPVTPGSRRSSQDPVFADRCSDSPTVGVRHRLRR